MASITSVPFGVTRSGETVTRYTMTNPGGFSVSVLDLGCILQSIVVPAKCGPVDVMLGYGTLQEYETDPNTHMGAFVGRFANRIENARFTLNGVEYPLEANNGPNHLHGCWGKKIFSVKQVGSSLLLEAFSPDGEDGFPGNVKIAVRYTLMPDNALRMDYRVSSDADTVVNLTNHGYFNLNGSGSVLGHKLRLYASHFLENRPDGCPTGRILPVQDTPMDFLAGKPIGQDIQADYPLLRQAWGYDHCYVIDRAGGGASQSICAWASSDETGISMKVYTTQPGVQLYTGQGLGRCISPDKYGNPIQAFGGFALETQHYPASPSHPEFPTTVLQAGKVFRASTTLRFFTGKQCGRL